jgi:hypothetical protein
MVGKYIQFLLYRALAIVFRTCILFNDMLCTTVRLILQVLLRKTTYFLGAQSQIIFLKMNFMSNRFSNNYGHACQLNEVNHASSQWSLSPTVNVFLLAKLKYFTWNDMDIAIWLCQISPLSLLFCAAKWKKWRKYKKICITTLI